MNISSRCLGDRWRAAIVLTGLVCGLSVCGLHTGLAEEPSATLSHDGVRYIAFSPDGETLVSAGYSKALGPWTIQFWDLKTGKACTTIKMPQFREKDIHTLVGIYPRLLEDPKNKKLSDQPDGSAKDDLDLLTSTEFKPTPAKPASTPSKHNASKTVEERAVEWWKQAVHDGDISCGILGLAYSPDGKTIAVSFIFEYPSRFHSREIKAMLDRDKKEALPEEAKGAAEHQDRSEPGALPPQSGKPPRRVSLAMVGLFDADTGETRTLMGLDNNWSNWSDFAKRYGLDPNDLFPGPVYYIKNYPMQSVHAVNCPLPFMSTEKVSPAFAFGKEFLWQSSWMGSRFPFWGYNTDGIGTPTPQVAFSPDGQLVASGDASGIVRIYDLSGIVRTTLDGHVYGVRFLSFLPDGWSNAYRAQSNKTRSGCSNGLVLEQSNLHDPQRSLASSKPFELLTVDGHTVFRIWNTEGRLLGQWQTPEAKQARTFGSNRDGSRWSYVDRCWQYGSACLDLSPDGKTIVYRRHVEHGPSGLLDLATGKRKNLKKNYLMKHENRLASAAFSPDGKTLASAGGRKDGKIILWDLPSGVARKMFERPGWIQHLAFSPDGKTLASAADDTIKLWNLEE